MEVFARASMADALESCVWHRDVEAEAGTGSDCNKSNESRKKRKLLLTKVVVKAYYFHS